MERTEEEMTAALNQMSVEDGEAKPKQNAALYKRVAKHYLADEVRKEDKEAVLTAAAYHKNTKVLVTGEFKSFHDY